MWKRMVIVVVLVAVIAAGGLAWLFLKPTARASQTIEAIPLAVATAAATVAATAAEPAAESAPGGTDAAEAVVFEIVPAESEVRFIIDEVLNGAPKTVVGTTDQVAGQIALDPAAAANVQMGVIQVNARTLTTDSDMRNRAISNRILFTNEHEYVTFTPTTLSGLPESAAVGDTLTFQVSGDLTVAGTTQPVTFDAQVTPVSATRLEGFAGATIRYADFGIAIPQVPSVTGVDEEVVLEIEFVAEAI